MSVFVKICGLTERKHVEIAIEAGADAVGFVFAESVRQISIKNALLITQNIPKNILRVAVMLNPKRQVWQRIAGEFRPDVVQTDIADFEYLSVPSEIEKWPVLREHQGNIEVPRTSKFIYEGKKSGHGACVDWNKAALLKTNDNLILAGGLSHKNISTAISIVRPFGVDVSSAVESEPGRKDINKIKAFIRAAKSCN
ncbi:phosphoribosylanthranilate isomerase [Woeseiaceae bacterium]|nr:phosphoribosylanthranilate isomerase [Woeseiaceae bacterium]